MGGDVSEGGSGVHSGDQIFGAGFARGDESGGGSKVSQVELAELGQFVEPPREDFAAMGSRWWAAGGSNGGCRRCGHEC